MNNLLNIFKKINFSNIVNSTNKTLTIIKKSIPIYKEVRPFINHEKTLFKKEEEKKESEIIQNKENTYNDTLTFFH